MTEPIKKDLKKRLLMEIVQAQASIRIAVAWFTDDDLLHALTRKASEGVIVEIILSSDAKNFTENYSLDFSNFKNAGGKLYVWEENFFHSKFCIIDRMCVFSGSANYTYSGFYKNHEVTLLLKDPISIEWFTQEFMTITESFREETGLILSPLTFFYQREIIALYEQIAWLETEIGDAEKNIQQYEVLYRLRFLELIKEILYLRKLAAEKKHQLTEKPETHKEQAAAGRAWEAFNQTIATDEQQNTQLNNPVLQSSLRDLYREAVKLCHPDNPNIPADRKEQAAKIFTAIKKAYDDNDEQALRSLLEDLKSGLSLNMLDFGKSNFDELEAIYQKLKTRHDTLLSQLYDLHCDPRHQLISSDNLDAHFEQKRVILEEELAVLKRGK